MLNWYCHNREPETATSAGKAALIKYQQTVHSVRQLWVKEPGKGQVIRKQDKSG